MPAHSDGTLSDDRKHIVNLTRRSIVCERALVADHALRRMRGLMGRAALPAGEGLLLKPAPSIHTVLMRFPIDVIFLDKDLHVLKLVERLPPWRAASARRARAALELAAGEVAHRRIDVGDVLDLVDDRDRLELVEPRADTEDGSTREHAEQADGNTCARGRVLLITSDRRFRAVAAALLTERGYSVTLGERMARVNQLATREAAEVVILDVGTSLTVAAREAAELEALEPRVGVVMVADDEAHELAAMLVLPKWDSFDRLYSAIEDARVELSRRSA